MINYFSTNVIKKCIYLNCYFWRKKIISNCVHYIHLLTGIFSILVINMYMYNNQIWKVYTLLFTILYLWGKITFTGTSLSMRNVQSTGKRVTSSRWLLLLTVMIMGEMTFHIAFHQYPTEWPIICFMSEQNCRTPYTHPMAMHINMPFIIVAKPAAYSSIKVKT